MKFFILLATIACAVALQAPLEYTYDYRATVGSGIQASEPQYVGTGLKAQITIKLEENGVAELKMNQVQVGEAVSKLGINGRKELPIQYHSYTDEPIQDPWKAYLKKQSGETVMEVPSIDQLWITNIRKGLANIFRIAPLVDPSSVKPARGSHGRDSRVPTQTFSRQEDTYAGRCLVGYTLTDTVMTDKLPTVQPDIQAQSAPRSSSGRQVKLSDNSYRVMSNIDFTSCQGRQDVMHTGAVNLTNITDTTFRDVASRIYNAKFIIKGSPGQFRIEDAIVESMYIFNPFGVDSEKMVLISNQTLTLLSARPISSSRSSSRSGDLVPVKTWMHQVHSPNAKPSNGFAPEWVQYKEQTNEGQYKPMFFERMTTGMKFDSSNYTLYKNEVLRQLQIISKQYSTQNVDVQDSYKSTKDGNAIQGYLYAQKLVRSLDIKHIEQLKQEVKSNCQHCEQAFIDIIASAGSGPSLKVLFEMIKNNEVSENRTATIFFNLANNIQSPEVIEQMLEFVKSVDMKQRPVVGILSRLGFSQAARRLCISKQLMPNSFFNYLYGDKQCDAQKIKQQYVPMLEQEIKQTQQKPWIAIANLYALGALGEPSSIKTISEAARGWYGRDVYERMAAAQSLSAHNFDNSTYPRIINVLLPLAENQREDYRVRQIAYYSILSWFPNATVIQRMAMSLADEPSTQMRSYIMWVIESLSKTKDLNFQELSLVAKSMQPILNFWNPSFKHTNSYYSTRSAHEESTEAKWKGAWLNSYQADFPRDLISYVTGEYSGLEIPLLQYQVFGNTQSVWGWMVNTYEKYTQARHSSRFHGQSQQERSKKVQEDILRSSGSFEATEQTPDMYAYAKLWGSSEAFLPMTVDMIEPIMNKMSRAMKSGQSQEVFTTKYINPVEINFLMPTPAGLMNFVEIATPTAFIVKGSATVLPAPLLPGQNMLPQLPGLNVSLSGYIKFWTKVNTYATVVAPWTDRALITAVDNEKTFSMPLKLEVGTSLRIPAQQLWAKIESKLQSMSQDTPIIKIRNLPFSTQGGVMCSPVGTQQRLRNENIQHVKWLDAQAPLWKFKMPINKTLTGIDAELRYEAETFFPFVQPNFIEYIQNPSRLVQLLSSPSIKYYELSLYRPKEARSETAAIGLQFRHTIQPGKGPQITFPRSVSQPTDIEAGERFEERAQKVAQFSNKENHELSVQLNFTGSSQPRFFEASLIHGYDERNQNSEVRDILLKAQLTYLQKWPGMNPSLEQPKSAIVAVVERPQPQSLSSISKLFQENIFRNFVTNIDASLYQATKLNGVNPVAQCYANMTVSELRGSFLRNLVSGPQKFNPPQDLYRIAVYDHLNLDLQWQNPTRNLKNVTMRLQDIIEGYMYTSVLKDHLTHNQPQRMTIVANRSISDNYMNAIAKLPNFTAYVRGDQVSRWWDWLTGFTGEIFTYETKKPSPQQQSGILKGSSPSDSCYLDAEKTMTYDGVSFVKEPSTCFQVLTKITGESNHITVLGRQLESSPNSKQEIKILSAANVVDVILEESNIKIHGAEMQESSKEIKDQSGRVLAKLVKVQGMTQVELPGKLKVTLKNGKQVLLKLNPRFKSSTLGLCGDYNSESVEDLRGPSGCVYKKEQGKLFTAAWIADKSQCSDQKMQPLIHQLQQHRQTCQQSRRSLSSSLSKLRTELQEEGKNAACSTEGYHIYNTPVFTCVFNTASKICTENCHSADHRNANVEFNCWKHQNVPQDVRENVQRGFMSSRPQEQPEIKLTLPIFINRSCVHKQTLSAAVFPRSDSACLKSAHPVKGNGPMLCVTANKMQTCNTACSSGDSRPVEVLSHCWNREDAPVSMVRAAYQGYVDELPSQQPQRTIMMQYPIPTFCFVSAWPPARF